MRQPVSKGLIFSFVLFLIYEANRIVNLLFLQIKTHTIAQVLIELVNTSFSTWFYESFYFRFDLLKITQTSNPKIRKTE